MEGLFLEMEMEVLDGVEDLRVFEYSLPLSQLENGKGNSLRGTADL